MSKSVCVRLSVCEDISGTTCAIFTKFFVGVACVRGSTVLRQSEVNLALMGLRLRKYIELREN